VASGNLLAAARELREALAGFDPAAYTGEQCAAAVEELAVTEKACAAARARAAARAAACGSHRRSGYADAADWLAREAGSTSAEARAELLAAAAVEERPATRAALVSGELSLAQAAEIARTACSVPGSEAELLALAKDHSLGALREAARRRRLSAMDPEDLHRRQHEARELRHWRDEMGMVRLAAALPPESGVALVNRLEAECDRLWRAARKEGRTEPHAALLADALLRLTSAAGAQSGAREARGAELVVVCDLQAFRRGHAHPGEPAHIVGGGPLPVRVARRIAADAFLKAVLHDGVRIQTVAHYGRHVPAELRTALELGGPPDFDGVSCAEAGCDRRYGLEWDHVEPLANGGLTSATNLRPTCKPHHWEKTEADRRAGKLRRKRRGDGRDPP